MTSLRDLILQALSALEAQQKSLVGRMAQQNAATAREEVDFLWCHVLQVSRSALHQLLDKPIASEHQHQFQGLFERLKAGEPLAYLIGDQPFYQVDLAVNQAVLIPRPETEVLVDYALSLFSSDASLSVLDLGTGSGAIAIALKKERPHWRVCAVEQSESALAVAKHNANSNGCNIEFFHGSWFAPLPASRFDMIISNPPYLATTDPYLASLQHEPLSALVAGKTGLEDLQHIISCAKAYLVAEGYLLLEHGFDQQCAVMSLLQQAGFVDVIGKMDHAGHDRFVAAR